VYEPEFGIRKLLNPLTTTPLLEIVSSAVDDCVPVFVQEIVWLEPIVQTVAVVGEVKAIAGWTTVHDSEVIGLFAVVPQELESVQVLV
jgi:hypothetical protein